MWEVSKFRVKAHLEARKRARNRGGLSGGLNLRRVEAALKVVESSGRASAPFAVRVLLNDLSPLGLRVFSTQALVVGQKVTVSWSGGIEVFQATGRVIACLEATVSGRILSNAHFPHRIAIEFIFTTKEEQEAIRNYCHDVAQIAA